MADELQDMLNKVLSLDLTHIAERDELAARLAELVELLRENPNAYAYDILETWEGVTAVTVSATEGER
jgi:hypothetical protein